MVRQPKEKLKKTSATSDVASLSDEQLIASYQAAEDSSVFAELVSRYERELYNYLKRYLGDASMAEDVFQTTFLQVHMKCDRFELGRAFRPWLYTIATNQAIDAQRRNRRHRRLSLDRSHSAGGEEVGTLMEVVATSAANPYDTVESGEQAEWVRNEVAGLPEPLQNAVQLVYFRGMKYRDAAKLMSIPVGTVKSRLHAAIKRLGESWRDLQVANHQ
ncbi:RNA polymerase sigma factor [Bythopirellula polymerisocia]|uniref:ECF RNA polymerase sigma factor SigW n=1 Tax=Bythopirellula polymerisocia TaxID=2528003 RepID=A0A5C6D632_9BACT|nr:RNA polymerase sigma factor [Bythopirellula polymerisocia]TWU30329.1 ECF RNA polymerase sigma factor SigW [Bythopirellula polymerisocia]